jgi:hypothetical protein
MANLHCDRFRSPQNSMSLRPGVKASNKAVRDLEAIRLPIASHAVLCAVEAHMKTSSPLANIQNCVATG